jgi:hypothetical protein
MAEFMRSLIASAAAAPKSHALATFYRGVANLSLRASLKLSKIDVPNR